MLEVIGAKNFEELLTPIPEGVRFQGELNLPPPVSELELRREFTGLASENTAAGLVCFRGAGAYDHFIPAAIDNILTRSEFFTAYTPYQAEVSQGTLQVIFEYQTMMARLTGCDAANACMYDGSSAAAEAALMAIRCTGSKRILTAVPESQDHRCYAHLPRQQRFTVNEVPFLDNGLVDLSGAGKLAEGGAAALVIQYPNFFGLIEDVKAAADLYTAIRAFWWLWPTLSPWVPSRPRASSAPTSWVGEGPAHGCSHGVTEAPMSASWPRRRITSGRCPAG